ncbi:MAG: hypothetical protein ACW980_25480 [Promethearchaeota archaeon]|jgi:hypothetical protein
MNQPMYLVRFPEARKPASDEQYENNKKHFPCEELFEDWICRHWVMQVTAPECDLILKSEAQKQTESDDFYYDTDENKGAIPTV